MRMLFKFTNSTLLNEVNLIYNIQHPEPLGEELPLLTNYYN